MDEGSLEVGIKGREGGNLDLEVAVALIYRVLACIGSLNSRLGERVEVMLCLCCRVRHVHDASLCFVSPRLYLKKISEIGVRESGIDNGKGKARY